MIRQGFNLALLFTALSLGCSGEGPGRRVAPRDGGTPIARTPRAQLQAVTGAVTVTRQGETTAISSGPLFDKDVVETGEQSNATLLFSDGRELELGENGRIAIGSEGSELVLNVGRGIVVSRVGTPSGTSVQLSIDTPFGLVRVGSGGVSLKVQGDETNIDVLVGEVVLEGRMGAALALEAGQSGKLGKAGASRHITLEPLVLNLSQSTGRVEYKKSGGKAFVTVNQRRLPSLSPGDTLRVTNGSAAISPNKSDARVTLLSGTEVGIGESAKREGTEELALELKKGRLQLNLPFGKTRSLKAGAGLTLKAAQGGQFSITRGKTGLELSSVVGDLEVETEGKDPITVKGGQSALINSSGVQARDSVRDALVLPSRLGLRLLHPGTERVALTWSGTDDKGYRIRLGSDFRLDKPLVDGIVHQTFFNTTAPAKGALHWRVYDGEEEVAKGSVQCSNERIDELGELTNEVSSSRPTTRIFFQDRPPSLTFNWKAPEQPPEAYQLRVYRSGELTSPIHDKRTSTTSLQLPPIPEGVYQWDVTYLNASGSAVGTMGKMNTLEVSYDNAVRALVIRSPRNGDPVAPQVMVAGVAPLGAKVAVNGQALNLDPKARFTGKVGPLAGSRVAFRVTHQGADTFIVRWLGRGTDR